jgi:hypothetical protein
MMISMLTFTIRIYFAKSMKKMISIKMSNPNVACDIDLSTLIKSPIR